MGIRQRGDIKISKVVGGVSCEYTKAVIVRNRTMSSNCHSDDRMHIGWGAALTSWTKICDVPSASLHSSMMLYNGLVSFGRLAAPWARVLHLAL